METFQPFTDTEKRTFDSKLSQAFRELRKQGYTAKKNFQCCQSCAWAALTESEAERAVFYHAQDANRIQDNRGVYLAHSGDMQTIRATIEQAGLVVVHDGSSATRPFVTLPE